MFRATMCPSPEELTVSIRHLFFTLEQVDSFKKLQSLISQNVTKNII